MQQAHAYSDLIFSISVSTRQLIVSVLFSLIGSRLLTAQLLILSVCFVYLPSCLNLCNSKESLPMIKGVSSLLGCPIAPYFIHQSLHSMGNVVYIMPDAFIIHHISKYLLFYNCWVDPKFTRLPLEGTGTHGHG